jgi:hypothetical protein
MYVHVEEQVLRGMESIWKVAELGGFPVEQYMSAIRYLRFLARLGTNARGSREVKVGVVEIIVDIQLITSKHMQYLSQINMTHNARRH